jgi:hypothetical protein
MSRHRSSHGIIFEFINMGAYVKVSAIDTRTGTEVSIVGDPKRGELALRRVVLRKLERAMEKTAKPPVRRPFA